MMDLNLIFYLFGSNETLSSSESEKISRTHITVKQKEFMVNYVTENPEMVTHSSTKESEKELWKDLGTKLNDMKPEKSIDSWKNFWFRWRNSLSSKLESDLKVLDCKLEHFLNIVINNSKENNTEEEPEKKTGYTQKKNVSIEEINNSIKEVEKEKAKLNLEVDDNDFRILKFKSAIKTLESENAIKRKRIKKLKERKAYLNLKKRKYEAKKDIANISIESQQIQY